MLVELPKVNKDLRVLSSPFILSHLFINSCSSISQNSFKIFLLSPGILRIWAAYMLALYFLNMTCTFMLYLPLLMLLLLGRPTLFLLHVRALPMPQVQFKCFQTYKISLVELDTPSSVVVLFIRLLLLNYAFLHFSFTYCPVSVSGQILYTESLI